ncbi:hypothetical protein NP233_g2578 [Leucocoprinus birnbaumii]|uniref:3-beta hydroxysteroid dehydrogenase/isomerase domain-containing protein n=1 Tax=Leucocoprinus birnbaumii TaxID=56174 RepID=A0AAD5YTL4_9AGAR|nr:hypothetical protein NP233_g2578 [Leucocoprinus birnbaumii]
MAKTRDAYMVIGGSGFLGRHIVQQLLDRGDNVCAFDIVQRYFDVPFYSGDITNIDDVSNALRKSGTTCIIHTASPPAGLKDQSLYFKVNVDGTKAVIDAAVACGVQKLVFTSSAGVVFNGSDIVNVDERLPYPAVPLDAYNDSKAKAEQVVLEANGRDGLLTVALRPAGIFGPGDRQVMTGMYKVYEENKTHFQIGDNTNLFDWTYVGNVAKAHLLAADKLELPPPAPPLSEKEELPLIVDDVPPFNEAEQKLIGEPLSFVEATLGHHRIPTSEARPLGPYVELPPNGKQIEAAFYASDRSPQIRPILRNRFDPLSTASLVRAKLRDLNSNPLQVAGQAFFITNGEPCYFWDFPRLIWQHLDKYFPGHRKPRSVFQMPKSLGLAAATGAEMLGSLSGKEPAFTRFKVAFSCATRWHNIEKARRVLGYEPDVGVDEGVKLMVEGYLYPETHSKKSKEGVNRANHHSTFIPIHHAPFQQTRPAQTAEQQLASTQMEENSAWFPTQTRSYILSFQFSQWYPRFVKHTIKSTIIRPVPAGFQEYLTSDGIFVPEGSEDHPPDDGLTFAHSSDEGSDDGGEAQVTYEDANSDFRVKHWAFPDLDNRIRECIEEYEGVFPKLNFFFAETVLTHDEFSSLLFGRLFPQDAYWVLFNANPLRCTSPSDVYILLKSSDFATHDTDTANVFSGCVDPDSGEGESHYELELVLRKWYAIERNREVRCFVRNRRLIGISQRDLNHYEFLTEEPTRQKVIDSVTKFWDTEIKETWPGNDYVFDFLLTRDLSRGHIIDFNPYSPRTDPLLFSYKELYSLSEDPTPEIEFRVITSPDHPAAASNIPVFQHNMVPLEALTLSSGKTVDEFAEALKDQIQESMQSVASDSEDEERPRKPNGICHSR